MSDFSIGMPADAALRKVKALGLKPLRPARKVAKDNMGYVVEWYLPGETLTLRRTTERGITCYRVTNVEPVIEPELEPVKKTKRGKRRKRGETCRTN